MEGKLNIPDVNDSVRKSKLSNIGEFAAQKIKFFIKDFFSKCDQIRSFLCIWSHLLKKSLIGKFSFCAVIASIIKN